MGCWGSKEHPPRSADKDQWHQQLHGHPALPPSTAHPVGDSPSFLWRSSSPPPTTSAPTTSSPRATRKPPMLSIKAVCRTTVGSPSKFFTKMAWPDRKQFAEEAKEVGKFRHKRLANLIEYCCDGDETQLVAEFMPNETLPKHLLHYP